MYQLLVIEQGRIEGHFLGLSRPMRHCSVVIFPVVGISFDRRVCFIHPGFFVSSEIDCREHSIWKHTHTRSRYTSPDCRMAGRAARRVRSLVLVLMACVACVQSQQQGGGKTTGGLCRTSVWKVQCQHQPPPGGCVEYMAMDCTSAQLEYAEVPNSKTSA